MSVVVQRVSVVDGELVEAFARLVPQVSRTAVVPDAAALRRVLDHPGNRMLVARVDGTVRGTLTLVVFPIPTGTRAWIEDVVVDGAARGGGVGAALTRTAVELAREEGARTVDLTSRPTRPAANRLYERIGVRVRDSRVYRFGGP